MFHVKHPACNGGTMSLPMCVAALYESSRQCPCAIPRFHLEEQCVVLVVASLLNFGMDHFAYSIEVFMDIVVRESQLFDTPSFQKQGSACISMLRLRRTVRIPVYFYAEMYSSGIEVKDVGIDHLLGNER